MLEGQLSVVQGTPEREIARIGAGEIVGEMSFVDARPPSATVRAATDVVVYAISKQLLQWHLEHNVAFAARFYKAVATFLSDRVRQATKRGTKMQPTSSTIRCSTTSSARGLASMTSAASCSTDDDDASSTARPSRVPRTETPGVKISRMKTTLSTGTILLGLISGLALHGDARADVPATSETTAKESTATGAPLSLLEAVRTALRMHPAIQSANATLRQRNAEVDIARGPFDPILTTTASHNHEAIPLAPGQHAEDSISTDTTDLSVGAAMTTTWGTTIAPSVGLSRVHQRTSVAAQDPLVDPAQRAHVGLTVTQPLLRGAGTVGAASAIAAARLARDAAAHGVERSAQEQVYLTLVAYFELVARMQDLALFRAAEGAARKVVDDTKALVEGQQRPKSDLRGLEGNLANRTRQVIEAENNRQQAQYALALAMGLGAEGFQSFRATDGFPNPTTPTPDRDTIVRTATRDRSDLLAARETVASTAAQLQGAERNTLPGLDLSASLGYAGGVDRDGVDAFFAAAGRNVPGSTPESRSRWSCRSATPLARPIAI